MAGAGEKKRQVPPALRMFLDLDVAVTNNVCYLMDRTIPQLSRTYYKALEISCHGIPWIVFWVAFIILWDSASLYQIQINFLFGLILDIVAVAVIKAIVRRRRPMRNESDMFFTVGPDKYSFPSGHASRAAYVAHFFTSYLSVSIPFQFILLLWSASVSLSRILLRRHHVLDVVVGVFLGFIESLFVGYLWLSQDTCLWLLSVFTS